MGHSTTLHSLFVHPGGAGGWILPLHNQENGTHSQAGGAAVLGEELPIILPCLKTSGPAAL